MDKTVIELLVQNGKSQRQIGRQLGLSQTATKYWLDKYKLKTSPSRKSPLCNKCGENDPSEFYGRRKYQCKKCQNKSKHDLAKKTRNRVLAYLGGKCKHCGFDKYPCSLDVHHLNSSKKDPNFIHMRFWAWERIVKEISACCLLCKNCHAAVHCNQIVLSGV